MNSGKILLTISLFHNSDSILTIFDKTIYKNNNSYKNQNIYFQYFG